MARRISTIGVQIENRPTETSVRVTKLGVQTEIARAQTFRRVSALRVMVEYIPDRTVIQKTIALGSYGINGYGYYDVPELVDLGMFTSDLLHGNQVILTGTELLFAFNPTAAAHQVIIRSAKDPYQRYEDINYTLDPGHYAMFGPFELDGWVQTNGRLFVDTDDPAILLGCVQLPG